MTPDDIIRLKTAIDARRPLPDDIGQEIKAAICEFETGRCKTLCRALGLRAPGLSSIATRQKLQERNLMLKEIAGLYDGDPWTVAGIIVGKIRNPPRAGEEKAIYAAFRGIGAKLPNDQSTVFKILKK